MRDLPFHPLTQLGTADQQQIRHFQKFQAKTKCHRALSRDPVTDKHRKIRVRCPGKIAHMLIGIKHIESGTAHIIPLLVRVRITEGRANIDLLLGTVRFLELALQKLVIAFTAKFKDVMHIDSPCYIG